MSALSLPATLPAQLARLLDRGASLVMPRPLDPGRGHSDPSLLCLEALAHPIGAPSLSSLVTPRSRVAVVVSDATRDEPREAMFAAVREQLSAVPDAQICIVIASGTHAPRPPSTALPQALIDKHPVVVHDGHDPAAVIDVGQTAEGTRVRLNRALVEADLTVSTGRIRPHYFAGYSGGAKGIFPGCAHAIDARQNHLFKADPSARLGKLDDNRCRLDMEAAARLLPGRAYLLNVVADCDGLYAKAFAGDIVEAHRAASRFAEPLFVAQGRPCRVAVTSDLPPVTDSLYQASKLLPPAGALLSPGGTAIMIADCGEGIGPVQTVNDGIYRLGIRLHLPDPHAVRLVSSMSPETVAQSYAQYASSLDDALRHADLGEHDTLEDVTLLWRAGELIVAL